jgi:hypothetical protein
LNYSRRNNPLDIIITQVLVYNSICDGFDPNPGLPFRSDALESFCLNQAPAFHDLQFLLKFKEQICQFLSDSKSGTEKLALYLSSDLPPPKDAKTVASMALLIDFISKSVSGSYCQSMVDLLVTWWQDWRLPGQSTMEQVATILLSSDQSAQFTTSASVQNLEFDVKSALGFSVAHRGDFSLAKTLLADCIKAFDDHYSYDSYEYGIISAELAKCCHALKQDFEGETLGSSAVRRRYKPDIAYRFDSLYLKIAFVDVLIGQAKYGQAETMLNHILAGSSSDDLTVMTVLRLNKVRRRLGNQKSLDLSPRGSLWKAVSRLDSVDRRLKTECADEVSSTVSQLKQGGLHDVRDCQDTIKAVIDKLAGDPMLQKDLRLQILQKEHEASSGEREVLVSQQNRQSGQLVLQQRQELQQQRREADEIFVTSAGNPEGEQTAAWTPLAVTETSREETYGSPRVSYSLSPSSPRQQTRSARSLRKIFGSRDKEKASSIKFPPPDGALAINDMRLGRFITSVESPLEDFFDTDELDGKYISKRFLTNVASFSQSSVKRFGGDRLTEITFVAEASIVYEMARFPEWSEVVMAMTSLQTWMMKREKLFVVKGIQTYVDAAIKESTRKEGLNMAVTVPIVEIGTSFNPSTDTVREVRIAGEHVAAICISELKAKSSLFGSPRQASKSFRPSEWKTYWGPIAEKNK